MRPKNLKNSTPTVLETGLFRKLKKLELWNRNNRWGSSDSFQYSVCSNTLRQLMTFSDLDFLLLYKIETMTDQLFAEILAQNQLLSLNNVVFDHCQAITSATIWKVIKINLSTSSSSTLSRRRVKK